MSDNVSSVLNELIETSKDGEKGFRAAAEDTKNSELKVVFLRRAHDCATSATDLQQLVAKYGGKPEMGGSIAGAAHRGWMNLKAGLGSYRPRHPRRMRTRRRCCKGPLSQGP